MKIIYQGSPKWWEGMKTQCPICRSIFELEEGDEPKNYAHTQFLAVVGIRCPVCKHIVQIKP